MRLRLSGFALVLLLAAPAAAQVRGLPVYNPGVPSGIGLYGDVGFANENAGKATTLGVTARAGFGPLGVTATVGRWNPAAAGADTRTVVGGTGNLRLFGGGILPVSLTLQGGYARLTLPGAGAGTGGREERIPVGLGLAVSVPSPVVTIKPWIAPRLDVVRARVGTGTLAVTETETNFGASGGIEVNTITGFGLHVAYDYVRVNGANAGTFGVGLHAGIKIPGL